ncbi:helix-turn-helix protein [Luteimonas cucumeris]|uniref:Helix-turn-helix protein n=1 Tax=Luteimonas cucumeris TaxID=985012 RepID=A0A562L058_9GAMM|nr:helix-turn-helix domain-containing protein [Luteimonas cucumeris]TWI01017.1 helix-turn-helix protein [Luteimonas cucumeris]
MGFTTLLPAAPLSSMVEMIWDWDMPATPHRLERMLPSAKAQLTINLAEDETRVYDDALACQRQAGAAFDAPSNRSFIIDTAEQVAVMGVVFRAGGAAPLFRERMDLLVNAHVDLDALASGSARTLRRRLLEAADAAARLRIVHAWLLHKGGAASPHVVIAHALRAFDACPQVQRIDAIAADCQLSPRRFGELFREQVGMSPKRYARLQRFHHLLGQVQGSASVDWAAVAIDCGFHDQPHLVHEFRAFSGLTPTAYLAQRGPHRHHVPLD